MNATPLPLAVARARLLSRAPYFAVGAFALVPVPTPGLGTLACDARWRLYYDPSVLQAWTPDGLATAIEHELGHLLRDHAGRRSEREARKWNIATDAEINDDLAGRTFPIVPVTPGALGLPAGQLAEAYYANLSEPPTETPQPASAGGHDPSKSKDRAQRPSAGRRRQRASAGLDGSAQALPGTASPGAGRCGSAATGRAEPWEQPGEAGTASVSTAEADVVRRTVATQIQMHSKGRGTVPGGWIRWAAKVLPPPTIPWQRVLGAALRRAVADVAGATDYSYRRPGRRQCVYGPVLQPSLRRPVPHVAVVVDTSGSLDDDDLATVMAEVDGILRACGVGAVPVLAVDAEVHAVSWAQRSREVRLAGGGGTDMRVGIGAALDLRPRPEIVIILTDGRTPWPDTPPRARVIAVLVGDARLPKAPDWMPTIHVPAARENMRTG